MGALNDLIILLVGGYLIYEFIIKPGVKKPATTPTTSIIVAPTNPPIITVKTNQVTEVVPENLTCLGGDKNHCAHQKAYNVKPDNNATTVSDTIKVVRNTGTVFKNGGNTYWQIQALIVHLGDTIKSTSELDIWCRNGANDNVFIAVYEGRNDQIFKIPVVVGHTYSRKIVYDRPKKTVNYILKDLTTGQQEQKSMVDNTMSSTPISQVDQGLEFNKPPGTAELPTRLVVELSAVNVS